MYAGVKIRQAGSRANCPQKLVRALKIVDRAHPQWLQKMLADFNLCCMKYITPRKAKFGPWKEN